MSAVSKLRKLFDMMGVGVAKAHPLCVFLESQPGTVHMLVDMVDTAGANVWIEFDKRPAFLSADFSYQWQVFTSYPRYCEPGKSLEEAVEHAIERRNGKR